MKVVYTLVAADKIGKNFFTPSLSRCLKIFPY